MMNAIKVHGDAVPVRAGPLRVPGWAHALWRSLERAGMRRAARHLEVLAQTHALGNAERAAFFRETAAECRRLAVRPAGGTAVGKGGA